MVMPTRVTPADGYGERDAALVMVADVPGCRVTLGGDKGYDYSLRRCDAWGSPRTSTKT